MTASIPVQQARPANWLGKLLLLWLVWAVIVIGFQNLVTARFQPKRPDNVIGWTGTETTATSQNDKIYLIEPFMNQQVSWDSEYYLSIALVGYDDPAVVVGGRQRVSYPLNYAFFPLYPMIMRLFILPLKLLGMNLIATGTLAGVIVSTLGALMGMIALYDLAYPRLGDEGAMRAVFYLLIFPTGFLLAQVYTEGLFVGLAFGSLALMQHSRQGSCYLWASSLLAVLATLTRAVGVALVAAILIRLVLDQWEAHKQGTASWRLGYLLQSAVCLALPVITYLAWSLSPLGQRFKVVDEQWFGRGILQFSSTLYNWRSIIQALLGHGKAWQISNPTQSAIYFSLEFLAILLALAALLACARTYPALAVFSLFAWVIPVFSGSPQSLIRYMLVLPTNYLFLGRLGRSQVFDRAWTLVSLLLMGLLATLFSFDFWVA